MTDHEKELQPILAGLRNTAERYQKELDELNASSLIAARRLEQIQAAIAALQGASAGKPKSPKQRSSKPVPDRAKIKHIVETLLDEKGDLNRQTLEEHVKAQLLAEGYSRLGVSRHLREISKHCDTPRGIEKQSPLKPSVN